MPPRQRPTEPVGLYDPGYEHDACGVAFVARLSGEPSHETVQRAITALENLEHRGAAGADPNTGDGAGMLLQLPDELLRGLIGADLPPAGQYGVAVCFLPQEEERRHELERLLAETVEAEGQRVVTWRDIPVEKDYVGITANWFAPYIKQLVVAASPELADDQDAFERKLYVIRRVAELAAGPDLVIPSFSSRTIVYKGMLTASQLLGYYPDLQDPRTKTALALVHSRFSTNTFPSWELAHPYRYIAHNGEINTLRGNVNWMRARESQLASELFGADLEKVLPVVRPGGSDSATFDNVLELLVLAGRSLPHAVMMMVPEAWEERDDLPEHLRAFYAFHSCVMEPWDGPAAISFTDGRVIGATLDRNGLRPGRWMETKDGWVVLASESGVLDEPADNVLRKGRLQPGKLFLVDLAEGRIVRRRGGQGAASRPPSPYGEWYERGRRAAGRPARAPGPRAARAAAHPPARVRLHAGGPARAARADGGQGRGADRLDGQRPRARGAVRPGAAAVLLLQAAVRAGHQPADRPDPRVGRDVDPHGRRVRGEPADRGPGPRAPARDPAPDPAQQRARGAARRRLLRLPLAHDPDHLAGRRRAGGHDVGGAADLRAGGRGDRVRREHPRAVRSRRRARRAPRSRRCSRSPPCTTTSCARARACRPAWCSSPASRARCTTSRR